MQTALLPFFLLSKMHRALYLPYDPPPDACVSAPTGSGKTLAYVIPIVEVRDECSFCFASALDSLRRVDSFLSYRHASAGTRCPSYTRSRRSGAGNVRGGGEGSWLEGLDMNFAFWYAHF